MGKVMYMRKGEVHTAPISLPTFGYLLNQYTWDEIALIAKAGQAANYFAVGDYKHITINGKVGATTFSALEIKSVVLGFDHNDGIEGKNTIHFNIGKMGSTMAALCDSSYYASTSTSGKFTMNTSATNAGGWASSHMRKTVLGSDSTPANPTANTLLAALPADLRAVMKPVTKYSDNTGGGSNTASYVTATTDYLPLLAEYEVYGSQYLANSAEQNYQEQYAYYAAGNGTKRANHSATTTNVHWYLRSVYNDDSTNFMRVGSDSYAASNNANFSSGVSPLFVV